MWASLPVALPKPPISSLVSRSSTTRHPSPRHLSRLHQHRRHPRRLRSPSHPRRADSPDFPAPPGSACSLETSSHPEGKFASATGSTPITWSSRTTSNPCWWTMATAVSRRREEHGWLADGRLKRKRAHRCARKNMARNCRGRNVSFVLGLRNDYCPRPPPQVVKNCKARACAPRCETPR